MYQLMLFSSKSLGKTRRRSNGCGIFKSIDDLWKDSQVDVVVELMGGVDVAKNLINSALASGKRVVTANKAVIALHGNELPNEETKNRLKFRRLLRERFHY